MTDQQKVPAGYKLTEVGVIPTDWEVKSYGQIFSFLSTASYSRDELSSSQKIGYIHYGDIHTRRNNFLDLDKCLLPSISEDKVKNYSIIKDGDIIMADASEDYEGISKSVEVRNIRSKKAISGLHTFLLRDNNGCFVNGYRGYISSSKIVKSQFDRLATGLKVYGLSKSNLKNVFMPIPTLSEQSRIATVLSNLDELITNLDELIQKKKNIKQGAMQKLLTPKKDWEVKKLGEILAYEQPTNYLVKDTEYNDNNRTPVLTAGKTFFLGYTNEDFGIFQKLPVIIFDDFTTATQYVDFPFKAKSSAMKMLLPRDPKYNLKLIYEMIQMIVFPLGDHKRHWISEYSNIEIALPKTETQNRIATILSDMDNEIKELEENKAKYEQIKQGVMQQLLTGKIRLK